MSSQNRKTLFALGALVALVGVVYGRTLGFGWVDLDDPKHIFENPLFQPPTWASLIEFWRRPFFGLYIPVTYTSWLAVAKLSYLSTNTLSPAFFHVFNLGLHTVNGFLVFALLTLWGADRRAAWMGTAIYLVHPLQVETVAWISAGKDVLAATLGLATLVGAARRKYGGAGVFFFLALLAKPSSVVLLPFVAIPIWLRERRLPGWLGFWALGTGAVTLVTHFCQEAIAPAATVSLWLRPVVALDAIGFYVQKSLVPWPLGVDYGRIPSSLNSGWFILLGVFTLFGIRMVRDPRVRTGFYFFLLAGLPAYGLLSFQFQKFSTVADRYVSFALIGLGASTAAYFTRKRGLPFVAGAAALCAASVLSLRQVDNWQDSVVLFRHALSVNPRSTLSHTNLAYALAVRGQYVQATEHLRRAVELDPTSADLRVNYGSALVGEGQRDAARAEFSAALALDPHHAGAERALAELYRTQTRLRP